MSPRDEIISTLSRRKDDLARLGVRRLGLFGSAARGESGPESDLDFVVEFEKKTFDAYMDLKFLLEGVFHRPVDLVLSDSIKPALRAAILRDLVNVPGL